MPKTSLAIKDKDLEGKMACHERVISKLRRKGTEVLFELSYELFMARNTCLEHKSKKVFGKWVVEIGLSRPGAYRAIARWEALAPKILGHPTSGVGCLTAIQPPPFEGFLCFDQFDDSVIDVISKPSTPTKALNAAVKIAQSGKGMTNKEAKALIEKHTTPKAATSTESPPKASGSDSTSDAPEVAVTVADEPGTGKCPNCQKTKWEEDEDGFSCVKCRHPWGEAAGDVDADEFKLRKKTAKSYLEYAGRAVDDLNDSKSNPLRDEAIDHIQAVLKIVKDWKQ